MSACVMTDLEMEHWPCARQADRRVAGSLIRFAALLIALQPKETTRMKPHRWVAGAGLLLGASTLTALAQGRDQIELTLCSFS